MTNIVFMGTPAFSVPILEGLLEAGYTVQAVVTQPDRPVGRKKVITPTPVKEAALKHDLLVLQPEKISGSEEMEKIVELQPDILITAAFGQFLPEKLLQVPKHGAINVHASLLPKYRGGAPVHYSIINGEKETGVTIMEMIKKMDAGGIFAQESLPITKQDDVGTMFDKLSLLGKELLLKTLPSILDGSLTPTPQDEEKVTFSPNITREQEAIDWNKKAEEVDNQVRGMRPWPIAFTTYEDARWKLLAVEPLAEETTEAPGTIIRKDKKNLWIACGNQTVLAIKELQPAGKGKQTIQAFLNGSGQHVMVGQQVK
ncbi:methionyl-tRNA formyltransferase [Enterococcus thailandicus]|uniref:Methionyl-tRNA formyltransferase n=1 Tax=Enterococcus thailandicus TaxID=417368 RepID=A0A510WE19_ENTTH|nr:methionyl-tRNA formyltransferase [Enterococcus thailandicus]MDT2752474.1 methionyl-tRNA formyltransferase [Enterococcus thailandicus]MDT2777288.1 methionyl-tRNA formyltransferase [Enterococcus thailandicus]MDT2795443.1 methionyl-tRNA formyltransferase [Enterococcus thailandicus]MDT2846988.1 methionyl-tRNA formyltransferase [Enterococcus thailandicus]GEK37414.1 methionyl-tRNA formyltransferase [Enterococcus thailandicus]